MEGLLKPYAERVLSEAAEMGLIEPFSGGIVQGDDLGQTVMRAPHGAVWARMYDVEPDELGVLGKHITLQEHFHQNFIQAIQKSESFLRDMCRAYIIPAQRLADMDCWDEWAILVSYLEPRQWSTALTFWNKPVRSKELEGVGYICDVRFIPFPDVEVRV